MDRSSGGVVYLSWTSLIRLVAFVAGTIADVRLKSRFVLAQVVPSACTLGPIGIAERRSEFAC
jgi:hypothetical protein